jgi:hypothetical protein
MTIRELADELEKTGVDMIVYRTKVEYEERIFTTDIYATLECRVVDKRSDEPASSDSYDRAMEILRGK